VVVVLELHLSLVPHPVEVVVLSQTLTKQKMVVKVEVEYLI
jgi:hypothetical protein